MVRGSAAWSTVRLDDADLALIEINTTSPLVERLVQEIRVLQDEVALKELDAQVLANRMRDLEDEIGDLELKIDELSEDE